MYKECLDHSGVAAWPGGGGNRGLQPPQSSNNTALISHVDTRGIQFYVPGELCVIFKKRSCDFLS